MRRLCINITLLVCLIGIACHWSYAAPHAMTTTTTASRIATTTTTTTTTAASTLPTTDPAAAEANTPQFLLRYTSGGGITGRFEMTIVATPGMEVPKPDPPAAEGAEVPARKVLRVDGDRAAAIAELLRRRRVLDWPAGIRGRGEWNDNVHGFLDLTLDGHSTHIHTASDGPTAGEAERIAGLMEQIEELAAAPKSDQGK